MKHYECVYLNVHITTHIVHSEWWPVAPCQSGEASGAEPRAPWDPAKSSWWHKQAVERECGGKRR